MASAGSTLPNGRSKETSVRSAAERLDRGAVFMVLSHMGRMISKRIRLLMVSCSQRLESTSRRGLHGIERFDNRQLIFLDLF